MTAAEQGEFEETDRIAALDVDMGGRQAATPELEQERRVAEFELLEENRFKLNEGAAQGPYAAEIRIGEDGAPAMRLTGEAGAAVLRFDGDALSEAIGDYRALCEAYVRAVRDLAPSQIERLDEERRTAHREGAEAVLAAMSPLAVADMATARRLFSLVVVLKPAVQ